MQQGEHSSNDCGEGKLVLRVRSKTKEGKMLRSVSPPHVLVRTNVNQLDLGIDILEVQHKPGRAAARYARHDHVI